MKNKHTGIELAVKIWFWAAIIFSLLLLVRFGLYEQDFNLQTVLIIPVVSTLGSMPAFIALWIAIPLIRRLIFLKPYKMFLAFFTVVSIDIIYVLAFFAIFGIGMSNADLKDFGLICLGIFISSISAYFICLQAMHNYFYDRNIFFNNHFSKTIKQNTMYNANVPTTNGQSNRILIKGLITGGLILLMMIPSVIIFNLIEERKDRQSEIVKEVSSKWANAQKLSGPFLSVPYTDTVTNYDGKLTTQRTKLLILPSQLQMDASVAPEFRPRSIYKVMLYKSTSNFKGTFKPEFPQEVNIANADFANARICFALSDFKGIEQEVSININGQNIVLKPGLPSSDFGDKGLSAAVNLSAAILANGISFDMQARLKGSEQLHYYPLAASGNYKLTSPWPSPSFDGNVLPGTKKMSDSSFVAEWSFNQANLPFAPVVRAGQADTKNLSFGVTLVQPVDQYSKTMRSVKYAILFIALTFALFFIIELLQKNPFHPVQYLLTGFALVIFFTLLLSFSEYILFYQAYIIAALATISLISLYAKGHFKSWKIAGIFFVFLAVLYSFIYILITLEDTSLLVGSIGLFIVLALIMYASRKINWYGDKVQQNAIRE